MIRQQIGDLRQPDGSINISNFRLKGGVEPLLLRVLVAIFLVGLSADGHQLRDRLTVFRDNNGLVLGLDLVHNGEALGFECPGGNNLHYVSD